MFKIGIVTLCGTPHQLTSISFRNWRFFLHCPITVVVPEHLFHEYKNAIPGSHVLSVKCNHIDGLWLLWEHFPRLWKEMKFKSTTTLFMQTDMLFTDKPEIDPNVITHCWRYFFDRQWTVNRGPQPRLWEGGVAMPSWFVQDAIENQVPFHPTPLRPEQKTLHATGCDTMDHLGWFNETTHQLNHTCKTCISHFRGTDYYVRTGMRHRAIKTVNDVYTAPLHVGLPFDAVLGAVLNLLTKRWPPNLLNEIDWKLMTEWGKQELINLYKGNGRFLTKEERQILGTIYEILHTA